MKISSAALVLLNVAAVVALSAGVHAPPLRACRTTSPSAVVAMSEEDSASGQQCFMLAVTKLSDPGADAIADVLAQAQKQGNWLRGLKGTVLVESEDNIQILAEGPVDRLKSFSAWCEETLAGGEHNRPENS